MLVGVLTRGTRLTGVLSSGGRSGPDSYVPIDVEDIVVDDLTFSKAITDSWETISQISASGNAQQYYAVGDCKAIHIAGTVGTLEVDTTLYAVILGFDHNAELEGYGITFGLFKSDELGVGVALCDSHLDTYKSGGSKWYNMSHWGNYNHGGWKGSDMRYDILGSTDVPPSGYGAAPIASRIGYDATSICATSPVSNTLMSCLPSDLRSVMKPIVKYSNNAGNASNAEAAVTSSVDYLPLLSEYEVFGVRTNANQFEQAKQQQYSFFAHGGSTQRFHFASTSTPVIWWLRSPYYNSVHSFCRVENTGDVGYAGADGVRGIAPIFLV